MSFGFGFGFPKNYVAALFTPAQLFASGEQGAWYDPSDLTTLFQDSAGTTPVTAVEQPVGLMLDKSNGLVLGPELVTNGDFSQGATGWVFANGGGLANSRCECTNATNFLSTSSSILTAGKWYSAEFDYFMTAGSSLRIATKSTVGPDNAAIVAVSPALATNAVTRLRIKFYSTGGYFIVQAANATFTGWVDNISVRELPGNHALQNTSANRPVLSARVNLLTKTEDFSDAAWTKAGSSTAPTASTLNFPNLNEAISQTATMAATVGTSATFSVELSGSGTIYIAAYRFGSASYEETKTKITLTSTPTRYSVSHTMTNAGQTGFGGYISRSTDGTATTVTASKADLRHTNTGANLPAYQRVNTSTDYDTTGFPLYLKCNGTNSSMQTNSINFSATDKMTVLAGVRKLSDPGTTGTLAELSTNGPVNAGTFTLNAPQTTGTNFAVNVNGTTNNGRTYSPYPAPVTVVLAYSLSTAAANSTEAVAARINATAVTGSNAIQGVSAGNFGNYPLFLFASNASSLFFNGQFYGAIIRGAQTGETQLKLTEKYLNDKTKAFDFRDVTDSSSFRWNSATASPDAS